MKEIRRNRWLTPLAAALNVAALGVIVSIYLEIDELDETWSDAASLELGEAALLTELERSLGYSGFIHHFKNYVLRREPFYAIEAEATHARALEVLHQLEASRVGEANPEPLREIRATLGEYGEALGIAREEDSRAMTPSELDAIVRTSDRAASAALTALRQQVSMVSTSATNETQATVSSLKRNLLLSTGLLSPLILALTYLLQRNLYRSWSIAGRYKQLYLGSPDGILLCDPHGQVVEANPSASRIFGYTRDELVRMTLQDLVPRFGRVSKTEGGQDLAELAEAGTHEKLPARDLAQRKDGLEVAVEVSLGAPEIGGRRHALAIVRDVSDNLRLETESAGDHLTGILNRRGFEAALLRELGRHGRYPRGLALLLVDLDHFKAVNDTLGHAVGDEVLQGAVAFLQEHSRGSDIIGRWGGDEFVVLCPELDLESALMFGERLVKHFDERSQEQYHGTTLSVGVACVEAGRPAPDSKALMSAADQALYVSKRSGRAQVQFASVDPKSA